ncbi:MAG: hypothetical protein HC802_15450 [Caldilineaceae bacterium]|nr:hypothetical protein [Caldilineaceae bacterium]
MNETPEVEVTEAESAEVEVAEVEVPKGGSRDADHWALPVDHLSVGELPADAINLNVQGRHLTGPLKGFGQLWQKTYRVRLPNAEVSVVELIKEWKANFPKFWPGNNRFYGSLAGIAPGEVAVLNLAGPGGSTISTGILVIYADEESFSFMTPEGHIFAGMNTFSAQQEGDDIVIQIQVLVRASDPLYELGCRLGVAHKQEDRFWQGTLQNLAARFGAPGLVVEQKTVCVDPRVQWSEASNIWHNAAIRTALDTPFRFMRKTFGKP